MPYRSQSGRAPRNLALSGSSITKGVLMGRKELKG